MSDSEHLISSQLLDTIHTCIDRLREISKNLDFDPSVENTAGLYTNIQGIRGAMLHTHDDIDPAVSIEYMNLIFALRDVEEKLKLNYQKLQAQEKKQDEESQDEKNQPKQNNHKNNSKEN